MFCTGCDKERYHSALGCGNECPVSCKNKHCDAFNGTCLHGCPDPNALTDDCICKKVWLYFQ